MQPEEADGKIPIIRNFFNSFKELTFKYIKESIKLKRILVKHELKGVFKYKGRNRDPLLSADRDITDNKEIIRTPPSSELEGIDH